VVNRCTRSSCSSTLFRSLRRKERWLKNGLRMYIQRKLLTANPIALPLSIWLHWRASSQSAPLNIALRKSSMHSASKISSRSQTRGMATLCPNLLCQTKAIRWSNATVKLPNLPVLVHIALGQQSDMLHMPVCHSSPVSRCQMCEMRAE
jgi:hypothetical protein